MFLTNVFRLFTFFFPSKFKRHLVLSPFFLFLSVYANSNLSKQSYIYDDAESRITKIDGALTTYYISPNYEEIWSNETLVETVRHFKVNGQRVASEDNDGLKFHYSDHLGSATKVASGEGDAVKSLWYSPFGADAEMSGVANVKYKYTGQEEDGTGLYYYGARYYDTRFARFLAADSWLPSVFHSQQLNRYAYVGNNPLKYTDPTGHEQTGISQVYENFVSERTKLGRLGFDIVAANRVIRENDKQFAKDLDNAWHFILALTGDPVSADNKMDLRTQETQLSEVEKLRGKNVNYKKY